MLNGLLMGSSHQPQQQRQHVTYFSTCETRCWHSVWASACRRALVLAAAERTPTELEGSRPECTMTRSGEWRPWCPIGCPYTSCSPESPNLQYNSSHY